MPNKIVQSVHLLHNKNTIVAKRGEELKYISGPQEGERGPVIREIELDGLIARIHFEEPVEGDLYENEFLAKYFPPTVCYSDTGE
jgi:hypothetical protein